MNGPDHYRETEEVLRIIASGEADSETEEDRAAAIAIAQVHATLALVAATVEAHNPDGLNVPDWSAATR